MWILTSRTFDIFDTILRTPHICLYAHGVYGSSRWASVMVLPWKAGTNSRTGHTGTDYVLVGRPSCLIGEQGFRVRGLAAPGRARLLIGLSYVIHDHLIWARYRCSSFTSYSK